VAIPAVGIPAVVIRMAEIPMVATAPMGNA